MSPGLTEAGHGKGTQAGTDGQLTRSVLSPVSRAVSSPGNP